MKRAVLCCLVLSCLVLVMWNVAQACPMCKVATESDARLPRAYMYSILFMLAMPATVFVGFSYGLWRLSRRERSVAEAVERMALDDGAAGGAASFGDVEPADGSEK
ncbi:MAG: hypothetical protein D6725_03445 [Planctomycetota bacterium]|nr:MAG: hypothetical protein D6725_03445 [Planctomycetota bacterium]